jgi:hypothetical protein
MAKLAETCDLYSSDSTKAVVLSLRGEDGASVRFLRAILSLRGGSHISFQCYQASVNNGYAYYVPDTMPSFPHS